VTHSKLKPDTFEVKSRRQKYEFFISNVSQIHINHLTNIFLCHCLRKWFDTDFTLIGINVIRVKLLIIII